MSKVSNVMVFVVMMHTWKQSHVCQSHHDHAHTIWWFQSSESLSDNQGSVDPPVY